VSALLVVLGAVVGAPARYWVDQAVQRRVDSVFPWGTFAVNVSGSLLLGVVLGLVQRGAAPAAVSTLLGTGLCGAFTTFSSFGYETVRLVEDGSFRDAALNVAASIAGGLAAVTVGWLAATSL
jgi:CrcB protein